MRPDVPASPLKAIRAFCIECCGESTRFVKECSNKKCPLHSFRFGRNPFRATRELTDEQKVELAERLRLARQRNNSASRSNYFNKE